VSATATERTASPYKGLANYTEQDAALFFGRDREREVIIANLKARRLTLLYGESGVGKSSLLRAGVMSDLNAEARENLATIATPEHVPVIHSAWSDDPLAGLNATIRTATRAFTDAPEPPASQSLAEVIAWAADVTDASLLIILDQFEEYFLYHPAESGPGTLAHEFPALVNERGVQANFIVSIREDALAKLDRFKRDIPRLFDSSLRIHHLDAEAAREAIERPVEHYNALLEPGERVALEAGLAAAVIDQVRRGRVKLEQTGQGTLDRGGGGADRIETPYLQLVMSRLWDVEEARGSPTVHVATLEELGGAQQIVRTHLDAALSGLDARERDTAAALFHQLVTPSGTKIAHAVPDLAEYARRPEPEVAALLEKLSSPETRILRPIPPPPGEEGPPRFEIFHDVLAPSVLAWRTRQTAAKRLAAQRQAARAATRRRVLRALGLAGLLAFAAVALLALLAYSQRNAAKDQEARARTAAAESRRQESRARRLEGVAQIEAGRANDQAAQTLIEARRARIAARRARTLKGRAEDEATRAGELAVINQRQAARERSLAQENERRAVEAQALARENRRNADRAREAAAASRRNAARANAEAARANRLVDALSDFLSTFKATYRFTYTIHPHALRFSEFTVTAPAHALIQVTCRPRNCLAFQHRIGARADAVPVSTVEDHRIPFGTDIQLLVTTSESGKFIVLNVGRNGGSETRNTTCFPAGATVPQGAPDVPCPDL
jgi:hypothetical protein